MIKPKQLSFLLLFAIATTSLSAQRILFVGNSLSYSNDLPGMVEKIGKSFNKYIKTQCLCFPNYGLEDHWNNATVQKLLQEGRFDYVVFQQGPSSQAYGRSSLHDFGGKISTLANANDVQPAYFMVWPSVQYYQTFDGVIQNHTDAATANEALLIPAGRAWRTYHESGREPSLYAYDNFHPSEAGSFLAALSIFKTLFSESNLETLEFRKFRQIIPEKDSFEFLIDQVQQQ